MQRGCDIMHKYLNIIKICELFSGITEDELWRFLTCSKARVVKFEKGEVVCMAGAQANSAGVVLSGRIYLESNDFLGNKSIVAEFTQGRCFGENYAFALSTELPFNIVAKENSEILIFDIKRLTTPCEKQCECHQYLTGNLLKTMAKKHCELNDKISHLTKRSTREKLISYLSEQSKRQKSLSVTIPFNRQELADYLAVERSAMSKELARMQKEGIIEYKGNHFVLNVNSYD